VSGGIGAVIIRRYRSEPSEVVAGVPAGSMGREAR
jgi:hypothetical protein